MLIRVTPGGPYLVSGGVPLTATSSPALVGRDRQAAVPDGSPASSLTRRSAVVPTGEVYTLCRCGGSSRRPFCDSTHRRIGIDDDRTALGPGCDVGTDEGPGIDVRDDGPLAVAGVTLQHHDGSAAPHERYTLCRCGASRTKPFCDGSHSCW